MPILILTGGTGSAGDVSFLDLYGDRLDRELGTTDRTQRFTTARRQDALNEAQVEFVERTECLVKEFEVAVVDETAEYDLETEVTNYLRIAKDGPSLKRDDGTTVLYTEGPKDFPQTTPPLLSRSTPGWRALEASTPNGWYLKRNAGALNFGLTPPPSIPSGETWTLLIPCVVKALDMSSDSDTPFRISGSTTPVSLTIWSMALVHYAAHLLERFRKDPQREGVQFQKYELYVQRYLKQDRPKGGQMIQMATDYRNRKGVFRRIAVDGDHVVD